MKPLLRYQSALFCVENLAWPVGNLARGPRSHRQTAEAPREVRASMTGLFASVDDVMAEASEAADADRERRQSLRDRKSTSLFNPAVATDGRNAINLRDQGTGRRRIFHKGFSRTGGEVGRRDTAGGEDD